MTLAALIPGLREPSPRLLTGGQPEPAAWHRARTQGVTTVINLRTDAELGDRDESGEVERAGLVYRHLPVDGAGAITKDNARTLWQWLQEAEGTVLVHCGSGNRVGALLAVAAAIEGGMAPEAAIRYGQSAGLGSAEARVREVLGVAGGP
ncbi:beta-lactamase hydrolase domain-containing protein [Luteimonas vadosa]